MRITILTTGGTIEKTYNESDGTLANVASVLHYILGSLQHHEIDIISACDELLDRELFTSLREASVVGEDYALPVPPTGQGTKKESKTDSHSN